jgi:broad specificity phosphatase PhoE
MLPIVGDFQLWIRHAHRNVTDRSVDNGLSEKGFSQLRSLLGTLRNWEPPLKPRKIYSSPKVRCWQSAEILSQWTGLDIVSIPDLDEQGDSETWAVFEKRVLDWIQKHGTETGACYVTHSDVLAIVAQSLGSEQKEVRKGDFFLVRNGKVEHFNGVKTL